MLKAKREYDLRPSLIHAIVASCVTNNRPHGVFGGRGAGNRQRDGLISRLTPCSHILSTK